MSPLRNNFIERLQLKGFTERTVCSYVSIVADLSRFTGKSPLAATSDTIQSYLVHLVKQRHLSARSVNHTFLTLFLDFGLELSGGGI